MRSIGITEYPCSVWLAENGITTSWYDSTTELYFDNHEDVKSWVVSPPKVEGEKFYGMLKSTARLIEVPLDYYIMTLDSME